MLIYMLLTVLLLVFMFWAFRRGQIARRSDRELNRREREKAGLA